MEHLIPQEWFAELSQIVLLLITIISLGALGKGADLMVEGAAGMAYRFGLPKVIVGATIISLGTTSPEFAVSVMAAWSGEPGLALGNAVGSIIADTGLIFGIGCFMTVLPADRTVLTRQGWIQFGAAALLAIIVYGAYAIQGEQAAIGRPVGVLFLILLAAYIVVSIRWSRETGSSTGSEIDPPITESDPDGHASAGEAKPFKLSLFVVIGLVLVIFASHVLICAVTVLAERWGVPQVVIAGSLVALGTSLPELVIGLTSILKGHKELLVGNIIGADILNVLFVIGGSSVAADLPVLEAGSAHPDIFLKLHIPAMLLILILFRVFIFSAVRRGHFQRWQGIPLLLVYIAFVVLPFVLGH